MRRRHERRSPSTRGRSPRKANPIWRSLKRRHTIWRSLKWWHTIWRHSIRRHEWHRSRERHSSWVWHTTGRQHPTRWHHARRRKRHAPSSARSSRSSNKRRRHPTRRERRSASRSTTREPHHRRWKSSRWRSLLLVKHGILRCLAFCDVGGGDGVDDILCLFVADLLVVFDDVTDVVTTAVVGFTDRH